MNSVLTKVLYILQWISIYISIYIYIYLSIIIIIIIIISSSSSWYKTYWFIYFPDKNSFCYRQPKI